MDLGVSSHQLDDAERGFSFRADAPLDMRMDPTRGETAAQYLARVDEHELARALRANGEPRFAGAIARSVLAARPATTGELVAAVERAVPAAARRRGHVATRTFQAVRVEVNDEAGELARGLADALDALAVGGVLAVISYHSGEDRVVKAFLRDAATGGCTCPPELRASAARCRASACCATARSSRAPTRSPPTRARARRACASRTRWPRERRRPPSPSRGAGPRRVATHRADAPRRRAVTARWSRATAPRRSAILVAVALSLCIAGSMVVANRQVQLHQLQSRLLQLQSAYAEQVGQVTNDASPGQIAERAGVLHLVDPGLGDPSPVHVS